MWSKTVAFCGKNNNYNFGGKYRKRVNNVYGKPRLLEELS